MKILLIRNWPTYVSVKNNTYNIQEVGIAKALTRLGNVCDILFWTDGKEEDVAVSLEDNKTVTVYYRHAVTILKNALFIKEKKMFEEYDILQTSEYNQLGSLWLSHRYPRKTVIYHGPYYSEFNSRYNAYCKIFDFLFVKRYVREKTKFITKSMLASDFLASKHISKEDITTIGVGIDADMLVCSKYDESNELYLRMCESTDELKLLYIGRIEPRRNIFFMLDVVSELVKRLNKVRLYMVGTGEEQYVNGVREYIKSKGLKDSVIWQETMEQRYLGRIYEIADVFLLPTRYEIFGMVLLEAMYYGMAVISTDNGGSRTLIRDKENGFILEEDNLESWVSTIAMIADNNDLAKAVGLNARKTISDDYTWDALAWKFVDVYRKVEMHVRDNNIDTNVQ